MDQETIYLKMPANCDECRFAGEMMCLLSNTCYPVEEIADIDFHERYSNCTLQKDQPIEVKLIFI